AGWIDVLFTKNGFTTHDIESNVLNTSLNVTLIHGAPTKNSHSNHLRVINEIHQRNSIAATVANSYITNGMMFECTSHDVPFMLEGSVRDDGPLPDVYTDVVAAADAMRTQLPSVAVTLMLTSTLHAITTKKPTPCQRRNLLRQHQPNHRHQAGRPRQPPNA